MQVTVKTMFFRALVAVPLFLLPVSVHADDLQMTTYYPAPSGKYQTVDVVDTETVGKTLMIGAGYTAAQASANISLTNKAKASFEQMVGIGIEPSTLGHLMIRELNSSPFLYMSNDSNQQMFGVNIDGKTGIGGAPGTGMLKVHGDAETTGKVGVGVAPGNDQLTVQGNAYVTNNVGIGVSEPQSRFHAQVSNYDVTIGLTDVSLFQNGLTIEQNGSSAHAVAGLDVNVNTGFAALFNGGNVGIGTYDPSARLHVSGDAVFEGNAQVANTLTVDDDAHIFDLLLVNGCVGIGTETPDSKLHIKGGIFIQAGVDAYGIYQQGNKPNYFAGNVGVGVVSPTVKLDVGGSMKVKYISTISGGAGACSVARDGEIVFAWSASKGLDKLQICACQHTLDGVAYGTCHWDTF